MAYISATLIPTDHKLYKHFTNFTQVYLIGPDQFCYPKNGPLVLKTLQNFKVKDDDVYVVTFPKTGTTWMQEIVYLIMNNLDFQKANSTIRDESFPYIDNNTWELPLADQIEVVNNMPSAIIYVSRNVKDTITSYYHFCCAVQSTKFQGSIHDFAHLFMQNRVPYAPYIAHVKDFWDNKHKNNTYFTTYEEMQRDQEKIIGEVAQFLNKPLGEKEIKMIANHCKFEKMKENPAANKSNWRDMQLLHFKEFEFMRKGIVGNWQNEMSPELIDEIDKWIKEETTNSPDLRDIL